MKTLPVNLCVRRSGVLGLELKTLPVEIFTLGEGFNFSTLR